MVVDICVEVPDEVDIDKLYLKNDLKDFKIFCNGKPVQDVKVTEVSTFDVYDNTDE